MNQTSKTYSAPQCEVRETRICVSILAGSDKAFNGTSHDTVTAPDFHFEDGARMRTTLD